MEEPENCQVERATSQTQRCIEELHSAVEEMGMTQRELRLRMSPAMRNSDPSPATDAEPEKPQLCALASEIRDATTNIARLISAQQEMLKLLEL